MKGAYRHRLLLAVTATSLSCVTLGAAPRLAAAEPPFDCPDYVSLPDSPVRVAAGYLLGVRRPFHPRRSGVRVFYASSPLAKEAGSWLPYTGLHFHGVDFTRYGLLAIFFPQTFLGETVSSITETDGGDLLIQLRETGCSVGPLPKRRWIFLYMFLDKTTLRIAPKRLFVLSP